MSIDELTRERGKEGKGALGAQEIYPAQVALAPCQGMASIPRKRTALVIADRMRPLPPFIRSSMTTISSFASGTCYCRQGALPFRFLYGQTGDFPLPFPIRSNRKPFPPPFSLVIDGDDMFRGRHLSFQIGAPPFLF